MNKQEIIAAIQRNPLFHLATIEGDKPHVRAMMLYSANEHELVFHSSIGGRLTTELDTCGNVEMNFADNSTQIRISGCAQRINNRQLKDEICRSKGREFLRRQRETMGEEAFMQAFAVYSVRGGVATVTSENSNYQALPPVILRPDRNILVIDNYDSFTYNLVHYVRQLAKGCGRIDVFRNDEISVAQVDKYDKILLSPGPGVPSQAGIMEDVIAKYAPTKSILGVCLGCQAIAEVFGGSIRNMQKVYHGVARTALIADDEEYLFRGMPRSFLAGRYHSWVVNEDVPPCLSITARDEEGLVMGIRHKNYDVHGVQFHPESVLTDGGIQIVRNWLEHE